MKFRNRGWYLVASFWIVGMAAWLALLTGMGLSDVYADEPLPRLMLSLLGF